MNTMDQFASGQGPAVDNSRAISRHMFHLSGGVALAAALVVASPAQAAGTAGDAGAAPAADSPAPPEIVVSATRRGDQTLLKVPQAIDAYSGKTLEQYKVNSIADLDKLNPSLTVVSLGVTNEQLVIRGISSTVGQTTGIYLDEAPLIGSFNANIPGDGSPSLRLHDVDHVEVLKGPQGTLFGAGSMDGTLRVVSNKPNLEKFEGAVNLDGGIVHGGNGQFKGDAMLNIPLIQDQLALRLVGWTEQGGGYIDKINPTSGAVKRNVNNTHLAGGRAMLRWQPAPQFTLDLAANYQHANVDGPQYTTTNVDLFNAPAGSDKWSNYDPVNEYYRESYQLYTAVGDYNLGFGDMVVSGSYAKRKMFDVEDTSGQGDENGLVPGSGAWPLAFDSDIAFRDYTAEARFSSKFAGPFQLVAGAYYDNELRQYYGAAIVTDAAGDVDCETYFDCAAQGKIQPGFAKSPVAFANGDRFGVSEFALYAQGDYKILPNLTATVGGRYFHARINDQESTQQNVYPDYVYGEVTTPSVGAVDRATEHKTTWNFALLYEATHDVSFYARAASGFRIGGINNSASIAAQSGTPIPTSYAPDSLWDYEVGTKFYVMDRKLSFDISAYHIDWKGQQINALAAGTYNYTINAGLTKTDGVEVSTTFRPTHELTLAGSFTYVHARLAQDLPDSVIEAGTPGYSGDRLPYVPHWTVNGRAEYEHALSETTTGYIQTDFNYRASSYSLFRATTAAQEADGISDDYFTKLPSYFLLNARIGARYRKMDLSLYVNNLTNKFAVLGLKADINSARYYTAQPRTIGASLSFKF